MPMDFGGKAAEHLSFFATHVIPFCESEYGFASSAEKRVIGGYSLGGLFSLYAAVNTDFLELSLVVLRRCGIRGFWTI